MTRAIVAEYGFRFMRTVRLRCPPTLGWREIVESPDVETVYEQRARVFHRRAADRSTSLSATVWGERGAVWVACLGEAIRLPADAAKLDDMIERIVGKLVSRLELVEELT
jgi:hypothetical protein